MSNLTNDETDARFWAQTGIAPGTKLDPNNPEDKDKIKQWLEINAKVKAEDASGTLTITNTNPHVQQNLAAAKQANDEAAAHLDAAAASTDPGEAAQHEAAATDAAVRVKHHTLAAAQAQPPTVTPAQAKQIGNTVGDKRAILEATFQQFWAETGHKPGQTTLNPHDPADAAVLPRWQQIHAQTVQHFSNTVPPTGHEQLAWVQARHVPEHVASVQAHHARRGHVRSAVPHRSLRHYRDTALALARGAGGVFVLVILGPDGSPAHLSFSTRAELLAAYENAAARKDQYRYVGAFDLSANQIAPIMENVGMPATEHVETPTGPAVDPAAGPPAVQADAAAGGIVSDAASSIGGFFSEHWKLIVGGVAVVGVGAFFFSRRRH